MSLKYLYEVEIVDGERSRCFVLADDETEVERLLTASGRVRTIRRQPGLVSAIGASRILTWVQDHSFDVLPPLAEASAT